MADHLPLDPGTRAEPYERVLPGWVHDAATIIHEAEALARKLRRHGDAAGNIAEGSVAGTLQDGFDGAAEKLEEAVALANLKLDGIGGAA